MLLLSRAVKSIHHLTNPSYMTVLIIHLIFPSLMLVLISMMKLLVRKLLTELISKHIYPVNLTPDFMHCCATSFIGSCSWKCWDFSVCVCLHLWVGYILVFHFTWNRVSCLPLYKPGYLVLTNFWGVSCLHLASSHRSVGLYLCVSLYLAFSLVLKV